MAERMIPDKYIWLKITLVFALVAVIALVSSSTASAARYTLATSGGDNRAEPGKEGEYNNVVTGLTLADYIKAARNDSSYFNWPQRSGPVLPESSPNVCATVGAGLKTLPTMPSYSEFVAGAVGLPNGFVDPYLPYDPDFQDPPKGNGVYTPPRGGDNAHWSAGCTNWLFDSGTATRGGFTLDVDGVSYSYQLASRGPWAYPGYLNGWTAIEYSLEDDPGLGWKAPAKAPEWQTNLHFGEERGNCYAGWERVGDDPLECGDGGDGYIIWWNSDKSLDNHIEVFKGTPFWDNAEDKPRWPGTGNAPADYDPAIYSNGTMFLRSKFFLSEEDFQRIAEDDQVEFFLDIKADDFFHAYLNGVPITGSEMTSTLINVDLDKATTQAVLRPGKNVLAIQALDKTISRRYERTTHTNTTGLWFNLRAEIPEATPDIEPEVRTTSPSIIPPGQDIPFTYWAWNKGWTSDGAGYQVSYTLNGSSFSPEVVSGSCARGPASLSLSHTNDFVELPNCAGETIRTSEAGRICARLTITNAHPTDTNRQSEMCVTVGIKPHVQVSGGDIIVRGSNSIIHAPALSTGTGVYGSWGEYGVFGPNNINTYSGGSLMASVNASLEDQRSLIFANNSEPLGHFASNLGAVEQTKLGDNWSQVSLVSGTLNLNSITQNKSKHVKSSGDLSISGTLSGVSARIEVPNGKVTITGDIQYGISSVSTPAQLPQLIIVADSIEIAEGVKQVDGWLVANRLITCNDGYSAGGNYFDGLNTSRCNTILKLNGPIQAQSLVLRRTAGATGSGTAAMRQSAEMVNLRPDAYIWAFAEASGGGGKIRTETIKELPPRF